MTNHHHSDIELYSKKSNEQRLKSLEEYEREKQMKKSLIRDSLNKSTHVKFDSDGEEQTEEQQSKKVKLFDDQEMVDVQEHFNEKKHSKKKDKLQNLQARLSTTNDPRFQFSEQFLEDNQDEQEISFEDEKNKSLAILDQITNAKSKPKTKMIRFDPRKTEHKIYEINNNQEEKIETKEIPTKTKSTLPIVDDKRTYEFDQTKLKSFFDKNQPTEQNGTFQFQFFNQQEPLNLPTPQITAMPKPISNGKSKVFLTRPDDTSSDDDEQEKPSTSNETEIKNETFFFFDIDARLKEGLDSFVRTEDINALERTWPSKRKEIAEGLRTKHRKAIQRKDKHRVFQNRRRQKQTSSKSEID